MLEVMSQPEYLNKKRGWVALSRINEDSLFLLDNKYPAVSNRRLRRIRTSTLVAKSTLVANLGHETLILYNNGQVVTAIETNVRIMLLTFFPMYSCNKIPSPFSPYLVKKDSGIRVLRHLQN